MGDGRGRRWNPSSKAWISRAPSPARTPEESYFVICDERVNEPRTVAEGKIKLLFGIAITKPSDFHAWLITHQPGGEHVPALLAEPPATSGRRLEWEIETAILRGVIIE